MNELKPLTPLSGEIISPANFTSKNLPFGLRRQAERDANLQVVRALGGQFAVQSKERVYQAAMIETARLYNFAVELAVQNPGVEKHLDYLMNDFTFGVANDLRNF